jgi:hypothetical protein
MVPTIQIKGVNPHYIDRIFQIADAIIILGLLMGVAFNATINVEIVQEISIFVLIAQTIIEIFLKVVPVKMAFTIYLGQEIVNLALKNAKNVQELQTVYPVFKILIDYLLRIVTV